MEAVVSQDNSSPAAITVHVVANFGAGLFPGDTSGQIRDSFARYPHVTCRIDDFQESGGVRACVERAIQSGADIVAAAGGDGTVSSVADLLVGTDVQLGVLPMGTLNHLAKDLSIPLDLDGAVDTICAGTTARIDVGEVNGRHFVNNVSLGAYPKTVQLRDRWRRFIGKWPAMILASAWVLLQLPWFRVHLEWNGNRTRRFVPLLFVGNNPYETSWPDVGTRSVLTNGVLWVMLLRETRFFSLVNAAFHALSGRIWALEELEILHTGELTVRTSRRRLTIALDGETFRQYTPLVFRSHPSALRVRVPAKPD